MSKRLTQEDFLQRVYEATDGLYTPLTKYINKESKVKFLCNKHNVEFERTARCFMNGKQDMRGICPECYKEKLINKHKASRVSLKCDYCGKEYTTTKSKMQSSKNGFHFCCRLHKDLAQKINSGEKFDLLRPDHYGDTLSDYRKTAFDFYPHICSVCGWNEDERILEVHHIDSNRSNCELNNLIILCPTCHRKITLGYYQLDIQTNRLIKIK